MQVGLWRTCPLPTSMEISVRHLRRDRQPIRGLDSMLFQPFLDDAPAVLICWWRPTPVQFAQVEGHPPHPLQLEPQAVVLSPDTEDQPPFLGCLCGLKGQFQVVGDCVGPVHGGGLREYPASAYTNAKKPPGRTDIVSGLITNTVKLADSSEASTSIMFVAGDNLLCQPSKILSILSNCFGGHILSGGFLQLYFRGWLFPNRQV